MGGGGEGLRSSSRYLARIWTLCNIECPGGPRHLPVLPESSRKLFTRGEIFCRLVLLEPDRQILFYLLEYVFAAGSVLPDTMPGVSQAY